MSDRFTIVPAAEVLVIRDGKILLLKRSNTGYMDGAWGVPSGHLREDESAADAAIRELAEETGIKAEKKDLGYGHILHKRTTDGDPQYIYFFFTLEVWEGEPTNLEPEKCDALEWFPLDALPENLVPELQQGLVQAASSVPFSEMGW